MFLFDQLINMQDRSITIIWWEVLTRHLVKKQNRKILVFISCSGFCTQSKMNDADKDAKTDGDKKNVPTYPLIRFADIPEDTKPDIIDVISGAIEKYTPNYGAASKAIKEEMDKVYGPFWHVIVGEDFGYDVAYQTHHLLYLFIGGNLGILVWKCS